MFHGVTFVEMLRLLSLVMLQYATAQLPGKRISFLIGTMFGNIII